MTTNVRSQGTFKHLVRTYQYGVEWCHHGALGRPVVQRNTVTMSPIHSDGGHATNARWTKAPGLYAGATGTLTVADNDFTTGRTEIVLGEYRLQDTIDYAVGADEDATATNIAAAISTLPGWSALAVLHVVSITYAQSAVGVEFRAASYGTVTNFTPLVPATGYLTLGNPTIGPPVLTP
jgi:hypothetical protein